MTRELFLPGCAFSIHNYGMMQFGDLFTARQKMSLGTLTRLNGQHADKPDIREPLALALTRSANAWYSLCRWHVTGEKHEGVYSRQALPIVWDFCEANLSSDATGGYSGALNWIIGVTETVVPSRPAQVQCADACELPLPGRVV